MKSMKKFDVMSAFARVCKRQHVINSFTDNDFNVKIVQNNPFTIALLYERKSIVGIGVAKRNPLDEPHEVIGHNIALIRAVEQFIKSQRS